MSPLPLRTVPEPPIEQHEGMALVEGWAVLMKIRKVVRVLTQKQEDRRAATHAGRRRRAP